MSTPFKITDERLFRRTQSVRFSDVTVRDSNGLDIVRHYGRAVSPPVNRYGLKQWYYHRHQTDNNRVIEGQRLFEIFYPDWTSPHWFIFLEEGTGALEIPPRCYHRSVSGKGGSILLNHAIRDDEYDEKLEFGPKVIWTAALHAPRYYNITAGEAETFIKTGELI